MSRSTARSSSESLGKVGNTDHWTKMKVRAENMKQCNGKHKESQQVNLPEDLWPSTPVCLSSSGPRKHLLENSFHTKAKDGYRYWDIYRPKPTKFGRYGFGSYKTFHGLGSAPRT